MGPKKIKTPSDSQSYIAEIVGSESLIGQRMFAGELLHMMDFAAASAAALHAESQLVTLSFDRIELLDYIRHRDFVRYETCVIQVGRSSLVVKVDGYAKAPTEMKIRPSHSGFITMVAIDENGRPNKDIPGLAYQSSSDLQQKEIADNRKCMLEARKRELDEIDRLSDVTVKRLRDYYSRERSFTSNETVLTIRKRFLPRNANTLGIVFGGDTIQMMEELAVATARQFTGNVRMVTIAMEDVLFLKPLYVADLVEMTSRVVFVAGVTLVVEVTVKALGALGKMQPRATNSGTFTVLNYGADDQNKHIQNGLDLANADLEIRKAYLKEQVKYENRTGISSQFKNACG